jgi:ubiquinone biosynthesis protein
MAISLRPEHLKRYRDIAQLLIKYGRSDLVKKAKLDEALLEEPRPTEQAENADAFADDLERMGPTYVKLGQLLSSRPDLLPPTYVDALGRLQDRVEPFPHEEAEHIVNDELGARLSKAFLDFDP